LPSVFEVESVEQASEALRRASAEGVSVSIGRDGGEVVLSTSRLNRVLEHEAGDLTCVVEAGVRVRDLNDRLAERGQMLALDPPGNPTIGACIGADLSGPRRHRYGTVRDLLLGVTVVLGDGLVANAGGKVVKNVAGYDLGKLFCGSRGRFGLVTRASLRLHPLAEASATVFAPAATVEAVGRGWGAILRSQLVPSAVDLLWPEGFALLFEGSRRAVEAQVAEACRLLGGREEDGSVWGEIADRQAASAPFRVGRLEDLEAHEHAVVRMASRSAYGSERVPDCHSLEPRAADLLARLRRELDPRGVLV
jgi:glycolate oxidase FAD binding subunit